MKKLYRQWFYAIIWRNDETLIAVCIGSESQLHEDRRNGWVQHMESDRSVKPLAYVQTGMPPPSLISPSHLNPSISSPTTK